MATGMDGNHFFATTVPTDDIGILIQPSGINGGLIELGAYKQQVTRFFLK